MTTFTLILSGHADKPGEVQHPDGSVGSSPFCCISRTLAVEMATEPDYVQNAKGEMMAELVEFLAQDGRKLIRTQWVTSQPRVC